jgi:tetratricopeptide (TPR) repeat protein
VAEPGLDRAHLFSLAAARELRLAGDYRAAAAVLRRAIADVEAMPGPDAAVLPALLNELGMVGKYAGDFLEAEHAYRYALAVEERLGRGAGAAAASILHNLAGLAHARGDAATALPLALRGIDIRTSLPTADPHGLAQDRAALAAILIDLGQHRQAQNALAAVLHSRTRSYDVAVALHNLGSSQFRQGNFAEAAATLRHALRLKSVTLGWRHPDLGVTLYNLARCLQQLGRHSLAERHLRRAVTVLEDVVANDHPTLVACRQRVRPP